MFKKVTFLSALFLSAPALAESEAWVDLHAGVDSIKNGGTEKGAVYGATVGLDKDISGDLFAGFEAGIDASSVNDSGIRAGRELAVAGRLGSHIGDRGKLWLSLGYAQQRYSFFGFKDHIEGVRAATGYSHDLNEKLFLKVEGRYGNYQYGFSRFQVLGGLGLKL